MCERPGVLRKYAGSFAFKASPVSARILLLPNFTLELLYTLRHTSNVSVALMEALFALTSGISLRHEHTGQGPDVPYDAGSFVLPPKQIGEAEAKTGDGENFDEAKGHNF